MKNVRYLIIWGLLVHCSLPTIAQKITQVYVGALKYNTLEKADLVKKEFSDLLSKVSFVRTTDKLMLTPPRYIPDNKELTITKDSVTFNISKNKKYTLICGNTQDIKVLEYSYLGSKAYQIELPGLTVTWKVKDLEFAERFADDLVYFQNMKQFVTVKDVEDFDAVAARYRALKDKPIISEESRKYVVQANAQSQLKNYKQAIELNEKAIEVDATNPMVYNNEALLLAMVGRYDAAINRMKKYLKLVPEAVDARAAQDKIYEWEGLMPK